MTIAASAWRRRARLLAWLFALPVAALATGSFVAPPALAQSTTVHTVRPGETLFSIARQYGLTVAELRALNGLTGDTIRAGQRLVVRRGGDTAVAPTRPADPPPRHPGARRVDPLPPQNRPVLADVGRGLQTGPPPDLVRPDPLPAGPPPPPPPPATLTRIRLGVGGYQPFPTAPPRSAEAAEVEHVVRAGDTLAALARRYGTTVEAIQRANGLSGTTIEVGQRLRIPAVASASTAAVLAQPGRFDVTRSVVPADEVHYVRPGETLFTIAERFGTTVGRLLALNTVGSGPLEPGTMLALPDGVGTLHHRAPAPPRPPDEAGLALVYPPSYEGRPTISGEAYDPNLLTASHRTLPFGTVLEVTAPSTGRRVLVRVNDRGPVSEGFLVELSAAAAEALGLREGSAERVELRVLR